jgi:aspartate/methionine/tyrosine aminotransferase
MLNRINPQVRQFKQSGIRKFSEEAKTIPGVINFTIGEPEFNTEERIKMAAIKALNENQTHYPPNLGLESLRRAVSDFERTVNHQFYVWEEVVITNGATEGLAAALMSVLCEGDEVIIPSPMYVSYGPMISVCKAKLVPLETTNYNFQIDPHALERLITMKTKLILITSPNNPTGTILDRRSIEAVKAIAKKYDLFILSDDVYNQLVFTPDYVRLCDDESIRDRLIITQSLSKPYAMTGWRVGYVLADLPIAKAIGLMHAYLVAGITTFNQIAAIEALKTDSTWMKDSYHARRDLVYRRITAMGLPCIKPEGAFYIFPDISEFKLDSESFCLKAMREYKVAMVPGVYFGADHHVRISYAVSDADLDEGLTRLETMMTDLRHHASV